MTNGDGFAELSYSIGLIVFVYSMFAGMLFVLNDGSAPAIILYPIVVSIVLIWIGFFIKAVNE